MKTISEYYSKLVVFVVTKHTLKKIENRIMNAITEFAVAQNTFNNRIDTAIQGIVEDVTFLKNRIAELQATSNGITPEDKALLDAIQARSNAIADKLEALDALTPPSPPVS
jgi:hypothetical protein